MTYSPSLFAKGFRPFFFLAAAFSAVFVPIWLAAYTGHIDAGAYWSPALWHGHEMLFGFTIAVVAGFLLTAVSHWTDRETAVGGWLALLCVLWLLGRTAVVFAQFLPPALVAAADLAFLPALAVAIGRPMVATNNKRNLMFIGILALLWLANLAMHLSALGAVEGWARPALLLAVDLVIVISLIIGGRIIPMFTRNATGAAEIRSHKLIERVVVVSVVAAVILHLAAPTHWAAGLAAGVAGIAVGARMIHWGFQHTWDAPILWVLHLGHAWIAVGLLMRAASVFTPLVASSMATHALTIGAIGMLTLGMMARVARGHTGRELKVSGPVAFGFAILSLAALLRAFAPLVAPSAYVTLVIVAGVLWTVAFGIYLLRYVPILFKPRADGRPG